MAVLLATTACGGPESSGSLDARGDVRSWASQERLDVNAAADTPHTPQPPLERDSADGRIMVHGRGAYADLVLQRVRGVPPPDWKGEIRVAANCMRSSCLHWIFVSADGRSRRERLPTERIAATDDIPRIRSGGMEAVTRRHAEALVRSRYADQEALVLEQAAKRSPYDAQNMDIVHFRFAQGEDAMRGRMYIGMEYVETGGPWLGMDPAEAAPSAWFDADVAVTTAPAAVYDEVEHALLMHPIHLAPLPEDGELHACLAQANHKRMQQYIGADRDADIAARRCRREHEARAEAFALAAAWTSSPPGSR
ncbi:hypothetical protein FQY83_16655 [Luteimonas marina]|uniref:Uncharacterized protein n=1 Tax=Luteimonas marina TaxID=488485 RepID=A0A5C5TUL8_9GAMM|nr:hypothetical protein [Luteimonas marina]TWT17554.1 hypothetical protein FQY83_16655 [Luteimonas marina]